MFKETLTPIRFLSLACFCLSMTCLSKQETTWNYLIVNCLLCSPQLSLSFPSWSLNFVLVGQGRITVWREEKPNFWFNWIEMYNFCMKKGGNVISFRINVKCFVLALLHTGQMLESYVIIGWRFFFFLIAPILGPFLSPFFKTKAFWKEKPNFQTQKFCFFLWHFHHEALCLWLHWNAMFWHFAVWMSG